MNTTSEKTANFRVKSFYFRELASLYYPDLEPAAASKKLKLRILANEELTGKLVKCGWRRLQRALFPKLVGFIVEYLGVPPAGK